VPLPFRSFRARILTFVIGLLVLVQGAVLLSVHLANLRDAHRHVDEAFELTASAFRRSLEARERILVEKARLISSDFAFKQVTAIGDAATIRSALENHSARVGADVMMLLDPSGGVIADTLRLEPHESHSARRSLVAQALTDEFGEASSIQLLRDDPYQLVVVPLFTPEPSALIVIGFTVDDALARALQKETGTHVSLVRPDRGRWHVFCTTLHGSVRTALERALPETPPAAPAIVSLELDGDEYVSWIAPIDEVAVPLIAVLQRSLDEALQPFTRLRATLFGIFAIGIALSLLGGVSIATRVTRPVADLARGARRIERGDYTEPVVVEQRDELGALADSFNSMMKGLTERDQVRDLLGRVVAPEVAEELLSKEIQLGGEERTVSVLFADIHGFTTLSEVEDPQRLVRILNTFLTAVSSAIEAHGGVVEEYMGDGAKALFGAPAAHADDALRAVRAALSLKRSLTAVNAEIAQLGARPLAIGIGIQTGEVVAGRMGSLSRLKYTVVGDAVNLASRIEGLTRRYGVTILVGDSTRSECPDILFREIDRVRVKGREDPVGLHEPLGAPDELGAETLERVELGRVALERLRARDWSTAEARLSELLRREPGSRLYRLFLERIEELRRNPPGPGWDGVFGHSEK
jgi:adenylate cyclase